MKKLSLHIVVKNDLYAWIKKLSDEKIIGLFSAMMVMNKVGILDTDDCSGTVSGASDSVGKGVVGEKAVFKILSEQYKVVECGYQPHSGDLMVYSGGDKFLVEVKNYKNTIPSIEMIKFRRDLTNRSAEIKGGVFICLGAVLSKYREVYNIDYIDGIMVIIINGRDPDVIRRGVDIIVQAYQRRDIKVVDGKNEGMADIRRKLDVLHDMMVSGIGNGVDDGIDGDLDGKIRELRGVRSGLGRASQNFMEEHAILLGRMEEIEDSIIASSMAVKR